MAMAGTSEATSQWQAINFCGQQQIINQVTTPALTAGNFAPDSFITHRHKFYAFTLLALLGLLQIQSQGNTASPFQVHPVTTTSSVLGILAYYLAFSVRQCLPLYAAPLNVLLGVFRSFSLASLATLLLPQSWWHIKYIFYVLLAVVELRQMVIVLYNRYLRRFMLTMRRPRPLNSARNLLPLTYTDLVEHNNA